MVASASQIQAQLGSLKSFAPPPVNNPIGNLSAILGNQKTPNGTGNIQSAIDALNAVGSNYKDPLSGWVAPTAQVQADPYRLAGSPAIDWSGVGADLGKSAPPASTGNGLSLGGILGGLYHLGDVLPSSIDNMINDTKKDLTSNDPWWEKALKVGLKDSLGTETAMNIGKGLWNGAKSQWGDWTDGKLGWNDIPGVGLIKGMGDTWANNASNIGTDSGLTGAINSGINNAGWNDNWLKNPITNWMANGGIANVPGLGEASHWLNNNPVTGSVSNFLGLPGIYNGITNTAQGIMNEKSGGNTALKGIADGIVNGGLEMATNPINLFTDGAGMAAKLGDASALSKINELANSLGVEGKFNSANDFLSKASDTLKERNPTVAQPIIDAHVQNLKDEIQAARVGAYNGNINKWGFSVPGSNLAMPVGNVSEKVLGMTNPFFRSEPLIGDRAKSFISEVSKGNQSHAVQIENALKAKYGVNDVSHLTKSQFNEVYNHFQPYLDKQAKPLPDAKITETPVTKTMPNETFNIKTREAKPVETVDYQKTTPEKILSGMDPRIANKIAPLIHGIGDVNDIRRLSPLIKALGDIRDIKKVAPDAIERHGEFAKQVIKSAKRLMKTSKGKTLGDVRDALNHASNVVKNATHTGTIMKSPDIVYQELQRMVEHFKTGNPEIKDHLDAKNFYKTMGKFADKKSTAMFDGRTAAGHFFDKHNIFNSRTLNVKDMMPNEDGTKSAVNSKLLNSMGNHLTDANSHITGARAQFEKPLGELQKFIKKNNFTQEEINHAIYHLEGHAPSSLGGDKFVAGAKSQKLAGIMKEILSKVATDEQKAGVLKDLKANYFPHVLNKDMNAKELQQMINRKSYLPNKVNAKNTFNQERKGFDTIAQRDNHLSSLEKDMSKLDPNSEEYQTLKDEHDRIAKMYDLNPTSALQRRVQEGVRSQAMKAMQGELKKYGMLVSNPKDISQAKGLTQLSGKESMKFGLGDGQHYMEPNVLNALKKADDVMKKDGFLQKMYDQYNAVTSIFRTLVTTFKPTHYKNNIIGNVFNNMAAGVRHSDYTMASKLIKGYEKGTLNPHQMKLMDSAYKHNVLFGGYLNDLKNRYAKDNTTWLEKTAKWASTNKASKAVHGFGEHIDNFSRLANYVNGINKFGNEAKAAEQVRTYLFNYNEMTKADQKVRTFVPFWNWMKRNVPLQLKILTSKPALPMAYENAKTAVNQNQQGADYQKEGGFHVPQALSNLLGANGTQYYASMSMPSDDLGQFLHPVQTLSSVNPLIKMGVESVFNKQLYTGKPIVGKKKNENVPADIGNYLASNFGLTKNIADAVSGKRSPGESLINYLQSISSVKDAKGKVIKAN